MDWVVAIPETKTPFHYSALLTTTCKATKKVCLTPARDDWTAQEWAAAWVKDLEIRDWSYPLRIISDRDPKFLSDFFKGMAKALKIKMLTSSAYHPQTDGQSERTNTVLSALAVQLDSFAGQLYISSTSARTKTTLRSATSSVFSLMLQRKR